MENFSGLPRVLNNRRPKLVPRRDLNERTGQVLREVGRSGDQILVTDHNGIICRVTPEHDAPTLWGRLIQRGRVAREARPDHALPPCLPSVASDLPHFSSELLDLEMRRIGIREGRNRTAIDNLVGGVNLLVLDSELLDDAGSIRSPLGAPNAIHGPGPEPRPASRGTRTG